MTLKCPNCGQLLKGDPEFVGVCPKCNTRVQFPKEKQYQCPHCGNIQGEGSDICQKCLKSMLDEPLAPKIFGFLLLAISAVLIATSIWLFISGWSISNPYYRPYLIRQLFIGTRGIVWPLILLIVSFFLFRFSKKHAKKIEIEEKVSQASIPTNVASEKMNLNCPNCGALLSASPGAVGMCPYCKTPVSFPQSGESGVASQSLISGQPNSNDSGGFLWGLLGFFIPLVGLILFLVWNDKKPKTAKAAGMGALICVLIPLALLVLLAIIPAIGTIVYSLI